MWYRAISLRYVCIQRSGIILTLGYLVLNFVSAATSVAELAHRENLRIQSISHTLSHSPSLFGAPGTEAFASK